jgi:hypothetical protein
MKGDFTRSTFDPEKHYSDPEKHYSSVRMQQGRVQLDSDWNEQIDIQRHLLKQRTGDVVGQCGAPIHNAGFALTIDEPGILMIGAGHYYVEGILCENETKCEFINQDDLPGAKLPTGQGDYLFYLDVWQRHITAVDDDGIREVALGGPDTATRTKTVWQVMCRKLDETLDTLTSARNARLKADAPPEESSEDPCIVPPGAGYRGLANHLYRVEIHKSGKTSEATFKWSRENGSIVRAIEKIDDSTHTITIINPGQDVLHAFAPYQWVEITDDLRELTEQPGTLVRLTEVSNGVKLTFDPATEIGAPIDNTNFLEEHSPRVRRWDQSVSGEVKTGTEWIALEHGLKVCFESENEYQSGDYWLMPARSAEGKIEWPKDSSDEPLALPRFGVMHHYCRLAICRYDRGWKWIKDCRNIFPPMTEMVTLSYVSGDGQEAMPGETLPALLEVRVSIGEHPIKDARVRFTITKGEGILQCEEDRTDSDGLASCSWTLDRESPSQQAEATLMDVVLLDRDGNPVLDEEEEEEVHPSIRFNANLSVASLVAYDPKGCAYLKEHEAETVQAAIDELCKREEEEPGILIDEVLKGVVDEVLGNYTEVAAYELAEGLRIVCDRGVDNYTVERKPTCYVTLYMPFPFNSADRELWGDQVLGSQPLILAADVKSDGAVIYWNPADATGSWLKNDLFETMRKEMWYRDRVLARLMLKGNFIWADGDHPLYLDGEWFWLAREAGVEYIEYNVSKEKDLIVENGLCKYGTKKKKCETQNSISGGKYYAKVGELVALNGNPDKLTNLILEQEVDDKKTLATNEIWDLGGGFSLVANQIDLEGDKVWLTLTKNGAELHNNVVDAKSVYAYSKDIAGETDVPMFVTYVDVIFSGTDTNIVQLCHTWLISDDVETIE